MRYNWKFLFYLIRIGLNTEKKFDFIFKETPNWEFIFRTSYQQGVLAIVTDGIRILISKNLIENKYRPNPYLSMKFYANINEMEKVYDDQYSKSNEIADKFKDEGVKTVVLKGIAIAKLYPKPNHRPCGDFDCFTMGNFEKGNSILESMGAISEKSYYKHSHYIYKGFLIENHHFCTPIKGARRNKQFERALQALLYEHRPTSINNSNLLSPSPLFNAIFLTTHSWVHFCSYNIPIRHLCDWAVLLNTHCNNIDWKRFAEIINIRDIKILTFARCISYICYLYLGSPLPPIFKKVDKPDSLSRKVLETIVCRKNTPVYDEMEFFKKKFLILKSTIQGNWETREFCEHSNLYYTYRLIYGYLFERNPHL